MTLTQDWHRVPGRHGRRGQLRLAAALAGGPRGVELAGVVPAGAGRRALPWRPPVPTASLRLRLPVLYDAWHRLRRPRVTSAAPGPWTWCT